MAPPEVTECNNITAAAGRVVADRLAVGAALRHLREDRAVSREQLADRIGLEVDYIPAIEAGETNLRWTTLMAILRALNVNLGELAVEIDRKPPIRD